MDTPGMEGPARVIVRCQECGVELAGDSPELRLERTDDAEPIIYCLACWKREFADDMAQ